MKPIEPGCKALLIHSVNHPELVGRVMHVIDRAPAGNLLVGRCQGFGIVPATGWWLVRAPTGLEGAAGERSLMRLDDDNGGLFVFERREHEKET